MSYYTDKATAPRRTKAEQKAASIARQADRARKAEGRTILGGAR